MLFHGTNCLYLDTGYNYSDSEMNDIINEKNIETIILIKLDAVSFSNTSYASTNYNSWTNSFNTRESSGKEVRAARVIFEIFSIDDDLKKPLAVINGNANNSWGSFGTQRRLILKILNRALKAMINKNAFE